MSENDRLRPHPQDRFDAPMLHFDLHTLADNLRAEAHGSVGGHRQIAIWKGAQTTLVLFVFDAGGEIPMHRTDGVVTLQVLRGRLQVDAEGSSSSLQPGQLMVLVPGISHRVKASEAGEMLLTVQMLPGAGSERVR